MPSEFRGAGWRIGLPRWPGDPRLNPSLRRRSAHRDCEAFAEFDPGMGPQCRCARARVGCFADKDRSPARAPPEWPSNDVDPCRAVNASFQSAPVTSTEVCRTGARCWGKTASLHSSGARSLSRAAPHKFVSGEAFGAQESCRFGTIISMTRRNRWSKVRMRGWREPA